MKQRQILGAPLIYRGAGENVRARREDDDVRSKKHEAMRFGGGNGTRPG